MEITGATGEKIETMAEWGKLYDSPRSSHQWKEHRSAYSVAEFVLMRKGAEALRARVSEAIGEPVDFEKLVPEMEVRFDQFGRGRMHDLGISGRTASGKTVFVGVEAKVDEPFGAPVRMVYLDAKRRRDAGESTNAPARIEQLFKLHFGDRDPTTSEVRYQLLYATAGTLAAGADISVLYIVVFKTPLYSEAAGEENYSDYLDFLDKVGAKPLGLSAHGAEGHTMLLGGKALICLHEHIMLAPVEN